MLILIIISINDNIGNTNNICNVIGSTSWLQYFYCVIV
ncbi:unnamed protein product [Brugia timori]|uniref:Uncharacterized protein n=1 Tax=Brugia timori TaxID=42155 RepID=A0A0R3RD19_9BILA|nr:unnamed protein product [Brugia timori]